MSADTEFYQAIDKAIADLAVVKIMGEKYAHNGLVAARMRIDALLGVVDNAPETPTDPLTGD